jgi:hypothetical protein
MARFKQSGDVQSSVVGDRVVLLHRRTQKSIVLNPTGASLWNALATPTTAADLAGRLLAAHEELTPDRAASDVAAYLEQLSEQELVAVDA